MTILRVLALALAAGCGGGALADVEADRAEIASLLREARTGHLEKRADLLAVNFADAGATVAEHRVFAWVELYEKLDGRWRLMAVASTDRPGEGV